MIRRAREKGRKGIALSRPGGEDDRPHLTGPPPAHPPMNRRKLDRREFLRTSSLVTVAGMSVDRQCSSGMMAIAIAAKQVLEDNMQIVVGGGLESISLVQNEHYNQFRTSDPNALEAAPHIYMTMLETAANSAWMANG